MSQFSVKFDEAKRHHGDDGKFVAGGKTGKAMAVWSVVKPDLQVMLAYWQTELRLENWRVQIAYVPDLADGRGRPVWGLCHPLPDNSTALIQIRDLDTPVLGVRQMPLEERVVHELSHLRMPQRTALSEQDIVAEENAVWAFSEALVRLKGTPRGQMLARAMVARPWMAAAVAVKGKTMIDPIIMAALKAALTAEDPKAAIEALIAQLEAAGSGDGGAPPPDMAQPPMQEPPLAARALGPANRAAMAGLSLADVERVVREGQARETLIGAARASRVGFTDQLAEQCRVMPLVSVRALVAGFELKPAETKPVPRAALAVGAGGAQPAVEASPKPEPTGEEAETIRKMNNAFGGGAVAAQGPGVWDVSRLRAAKASKVPQGGAPAPA